MSSENNADDLVADIEELIKEEERKEHPDYGITGLNDEAERPPPASLQ
jgi:hypothetical protein